MALNELRHASGNTFRGRRDAPPGPSIKKLQDKVLRTLCSPPHHLPDDQDHLRVILDRIFCKSFNPIPYGKELQQRTEFHPQDRLEATRCIRDLVHSYATNRYAAHLHRTGVMSIP